MDIKKNTIILTIYLCSTLLFMLTSCTSQQTPLPLLPLSDGEEHDLSSPTSVQTLVVEPAIEPDTTEMTATLVQVSPIETPTPISGEEVSMELPTDTPPPTIVPPTDTPVPQAIVSSPTSAPIATSSPTSTSTPTPTPTVETWRYETINFGVDFDFVPYDSELFTYDLPLVQNLNMNWVRVWISWSFIEQAPGEYNWEYYDTALEGLSQAGLKPLAIIYGMPTWAVVDGNNCGPTSDIEAYKAFLSAAVTRYGYLVDAWEFTNEPDAKEPGPWGAATGCWGNRPEVYTGQLAVFHNTIRALNPNDLIVFGGLAYDNWGYFERSFFEKALQHGAGSFFDIVNFHYYPINLAEFPTMLHKLQEIQGIMARNNIQNKDIWITETAMWVNNINAEPINGTLEKQRNFISQNYSRAFCNGVTNIFWFEVRESLTVNRVPHLNRWFINAAHEPVNGYTTFQHYANKVRYTNCMGQYQAVPENIEAYHFTAYNRDLYILWSNAGNQLVTIPVSTSAILTDREGNLMNTNPIENGQITFEVSTSPVFLEIAK